jgi:hypothetical protein
MGDNDQALVYANQAATTAGDGDNDTLEVIAYGALGHCYLRRNEKLLAFRNYDNIHEYDKAIDYELREIGLDRKMRHFDELINDYIYVAITFAEKKAYVIATGLFEYSIGAVASLAGA